MAQITDEVTGLVKNMSLPELQNMVLRLAEQNEHVLAALQQVWREKEREIRLRASVEWAPADWFEASKHFEPIITDELEQCAALFKDRYEHSYRSYDYYDSEDGRWDFSAGMEQLDNWFKELLEMAADGEWIDASVGLLLTLQRLEEWARENGDEDIDGEDLADECSPYWINAEKLTAIIGDSTAPASNKSAFFYELIDWIAGICAEEDDWLNWRETLAGCLFSIQHYEHLKEHVKKFEPELFENDDASAIETELVRWWVQISLQMGYEPEAERAETRLTTFDPETSACFVRYYERMDRTEEAISRLHIILQHVNEQLQQKSSDTFIRGQLPVISEQQAANYYEWLVTLYEQTGHQTKAELWRVQWFKLLPTLELFKRCLEAAAPTEKEALSIKWIAHVRSKNSQRYEDLLIDMHLHIGNISEAWSIYKASRNTSDWISATVRQLFEVMKHHDPKRLVPIFRQYVQRRIAEKNRKSYQKAAEWLEELKAVYLLLEQAGAWNDYLQELRENHRRLPALQDEITRAKL